MSKPLLSLCSIPKLAIRDGYVGQFARLLLPFSTYGYWFASGAQYTFTGTSIRQTPGEMALVGVTKPNTYKKAADVCIGG